MEQAQGEQITSGGEEMAGGDADPPTGAGAPHPLRRVEGADSIGEGGSKDQESPDEQADDTLGVRAFVKKWGLDERNVPILEGLTEESRAKVMGNFAPAADTINMNARFTVWLRMKVKDNKVVAGLRRETSRVRAGRDGGGAGKEGLDAFVERWELSAESRKLLEGMPPAERKAVMSSFSPQSGANDIDAELATHVKSKKNQKAARRDVPVGTGAIGGLPLAPPAPPGLAPRARGAGGPDPVEQFVQQWGLKEQSGRLLRGLAEPLQQTIIAGFAPGKNIKNVNAKLHAYVQSKVSEMTGKGLNDPFPQAVSHPPGAATQETVPWNIIRHFGERWSLDNYALDTLAQLHPDVCAHVITNFNPPAGTRNVNGRLHSFIRQRLETSRYQQPPPQPTRSQYGWGGTPETWYDSGAAAPSPGKGGGKAGPRMRAGPAIGSGAPVGGGGAAIGSGAGKGGTAIGSAAAEEPPSRSARGKGSSKSRTRAVVPPVDLEDLDEPTAAFLARWELNADAQHAVCDLPEDLRSRVFSEFEPGDETRDMSGRLKVFIRTKILPRGAQNSRRRLGAEGASQAIGERKPPPPSPSPGEDS